MSLIFQTLKTFREADRCAGLRNRILGSLLIALGRMGANRKSLRKMVGKLIRCFGDKEFVNLKFIETDDTTIKLSMRKNDLEDFVTGGELLAVQYQLPNFIPCQIIDGGGNIGALSLVARAHFPESSLIIFEPDPSNREILQRNLLENKFDADIRNEALWSHECKMVFQRHSSNTGKLDTTADASGNMVNCVELPSLEHPCWLKLDIEGAEHEVIPALLNSKQFPEQISLEIHYFNTPRGRNLIRLLEKNGYEIKGGEDPSAECCVVDAVYSSAR